MAKTVLVMPRWDVARTVPGHGRYDDEKRQHESGLHFHTSQVPFGP